MLSLTSAIARWPPFLRGILRSAFGYQRWASSLRVDTSITRQLSAAISSGMCFSRNSLSLYTAFPARLSTPGAACVRTNASTCSFASRRLSVLARTRSTRPDAACCRVHQSFMPESTSSGCATTSSGPSTRRPSAASESTHASSRMWSACASSPVISRSSQSIEPWPKGRGLRARTLAADGCGEPPPFSPRAVPPPCLSLAELSPELGPALSLSLSPPPARAVPRDFCAPGRRPARAPSARVTKVSPVSSSLPARFSAAKELGAMAGAVARGGVVARAARPWSQL
mmetsp:Transcript_21845/g.55429  ORF Transcript_21845/g.55429 Transcript_21845/m.55429 type:complete len:285 (+) Transcript_21845:210-1064(+)